MGGSGLTVSRVGWKALAGAAERRKKLFPLAAEKWDRYGGR